MGEAGYVLAEHGAGPGVAVALEHAVEGLVGHPGGGLQCGGDLVGMVAVVVEDADAVPFAHELEPALGVLEPVQSPGRALEVGPEDGGYGRGGDGVDDVVGAGHVEGDPAQILSLMDDCFCSLFIAFRKFLFENIFP